MIVGLITTVLALALLVLFRVIGMVRFVAYATKAFEAAPAVSDATLVHYNDQGMELYDDRKDRVRDERFRMNILCSFAMLPCLFFGGLLMSGVSFHQPVLWGSMVLALAATTYYAWRACNAPRIYAKEEARSIKRSRSVAT